MHLSALIGTYRYLSELIGILRLGAIVDLQSKITGLIWPYLAISGHKWTEVDNGLWRCSRFVGEITDMIAFALYTSSPNEKSEICANKRTQHAASLQKYEGSKCSVLSFFWSKNGQKWKITLSLLGKRRVVPLWSRFKSDEKGLDFLSFEPETAHSNFGREKADAARCVPTKRIDNVLIMSNVWTLRAASEGAKKMSFITPNIGCTFVMNLRTQCIASLQKNEI